MDEAIGSSSTPFAVDGGSGLGCCANWRARASLLRSIAKIRWDQTGAAEIVRVWTTLGGAHIAAGQDLQATLQRVLGAFSNPGVGVVREVLQQMWRNDEAWRRGHVATVPLMTDNVGWAEASAQYVSGFSTRLGGVALR